MSSRNVCVLGLGYVGLPLACAAAGAGHTVVGYDPDVARVRGLREGRSPVEDVEDRLLEKVLAGGRVRFTHDVADLQGCDTFVICVPTPLTEKTPDLTMVDAAVEVVATALRPGGMVVLESTTYPGTTEDRVAPKIAELTGLTAPDDYHLVFSPERIDPGNPIYQLSNTPRVVGGLGRRAGDAAEAFYASFIDHVHRVSGPREAEMAKLLENTYRHVNIALVNEMAIFCEELGINLWESIGAASTKPFGFAAFSPGPGVGGHCIPVDPSYLSWRVRRLGYPFRFVELAGEINDRMPSYVAARVADLLNDVQKSVNGARILVLGVAYKRDIGDMRESPAPVLIRKLEGRGAQVRWHDPHVSGPIADTAAVAVAGELTAEELAAADLVLVHTDHSAYDPQLVVRHARRVFDTRNMTAGLTAQHLFRL
ncbi:MAG: nucleotide sugar dehydrogenase [Nocardioidaceae bacterium]|nr:nucleotide sugar dehydrogenase [Nocardioidaceae bacterium]NUS52070.1 nucleotide sugar dehydrogenase [Nocardioidaceae bacterium]